MSAIIPYLSTIQTMRNLKLVQPFRTSLAITYELLLPAANELSIALQANPNLAIEVQDRDRAAVARYAILAPRVTVKILKL